MVSPASWATSVKYAMEFLGGEGSLWADPNPPNQIGTNKMAHGTQFEGKRKYRGKRVTPNAW
jgi:hypothetical protein